MITPRCFVRWAFRFFCGHTRDGNAPPLQADRLYMENRIEIQNMMAQMAQRGRKRIAFAGDKEHCQSL